MKTLTINLGDLQPRRCHKCGGNYGYQVTDNVRGQYTTLYNEFGDMEGGFYGDSMATSKQGTRAYCSNCGADLKINIKRS